MKKHFRQTRWPTSTWIDSHSNSTRQIKITIRQFQCWWYSIYSIEVLLPSVTPSLTSAPRSESVYQTLYFKFPQSILQMDGQEKQRRKKWSGEDESNTKGILLLWVILILHLGGNIVKRILHILIVVEFTNAPFDFINISSSRKYSPYYTRATALSLVL